MTNPETMTKLEIRNDAHSFRHLGLVTFET